MFKKAVISDEISQDLQVACDLAKKYGFQGLEIRSVWDKGPHKLSDEEIAKIREIMDANALEVCGISAPFLKCDIMNENEVAEQFDVVLARCMVLAKGVGTSYIRGFTGWKKGELSDALPRITELLRRASDILAKEGMTLLIEMDPSVYAYDAKSIAEVVKSVARDNICALFDPGNLMWNKNPEVPYPDAYETLKPYIRHVHIKDYNIYNEPTGIRRKTAKPFVSRWVPAAWISRDFLHDSKQRAMRVTLFWKLTTA